MDFSWITVEEIKKDLKNNLKVHLHQDKYWYYVFFRMYVKVKRQKILRSGGVDMLQVQLMKPFNMKIEDDRIKLVFAYQYFSIRKEDEIFQFIPVEGKEIIINAKNLQVENLSDIFVFQKGNRFIRLPLYQLMLVSDIHVHLQEIIDANNKVPVEELSIEGIAELIDILEKENYKQMIDYSLDHRDELLFQQLMEL